MSVVGPRTVLPDPSTRIGGSHALFWGFMFFVAFCIGWESFALVFVLLIAWLCWRGDRDAGPMKGRH